MNTLLKCFFAIVLAVMLWLTITASLERGVLVALEELWADRWFQAALADAYFSFITVYLLVVWREASVRSRVIWFVVFMGLGSIGIAIYAFSKLFSRSAATRDAFIDSPGLGEGARR